jgi:hypothetical protein
LTYTRDTADAICARLAAGESLRAICATKGMPPRSTVRGWAVDDVDGFAARYARARELGFEEIAEQTIEIADDITRDTIEGPDGRRLPDSEWISRSRLRVDARKWLLSKMLPKVYGDRVTQEHTGEGGGPIRIITGNPRVDGA